MIYKKKNKWDKFKKVDWNTLFLRIFANGSMNYDLPKEKA
jgi:hypothetical protein